MAILIFILIVYGLSNAIIYTSGPFYIFDYFQNFMNKFPSNIGHGYECMICFPFQIGILLSLLNGFIIEPLDVTITPMYYINNHEEYWYINMLLDGAIASGTTWLLHTIQECIENISGYHEYYTLVEKERNEEQNE